jgi:hypothetical protein
MSEVKTDSREAAPETPAYSVEDLKVPAQAQELAKSFTERAKETMHPDQIDGLVEEGIRAGLFERPLDPESPPQPDDIFGGYKVESVKGPDGKPLHGGETVLNSLRLAKSEAISNRVALGLADKMQAVPVGRRTEVLAAEISKAAQAGDIRLNEKGKLLDGQNGTEWAVKLGVERTVNDIYKKPEEREQLDRAVLDAVEKLNQKPSNEELEEQSRRKLDWLYHPDNPQGYAGNIEAAAHNQQVAEQGITEARQRYEAGLRSTAEALADGEISAEASPRRRELLQKNQEQLAEDQLKELIHDDALKENTEKETQAHRQAIELSAAVLKGEVDQAVLARHEREWRVDANDLDAEEKAAVNKAVLGLKADAIPDWEETKGGLWRGPRTVGKYFVVPDNPHAVIYERRLRRTGQLIGQTIMTSDKAGRPAGRHPEDWSTRHSLPSGTRGRARQEQLHDQTSVHIETGLADTMAGWADFLPARVLTQSHSYDMRRRVRPRNRMGYLARLFSLGLNS